MAGKPMTGQAFFVLTALADGPRHGYGIVGEVAGLSQVRVRLKIGSLYGVLDRRRIRTRNERTQNNAVQPPPRLPAAAASVLAAGLMLTAAGCSQLTPLGPDPAATIPQPHHLRSPLVLQNVPIRPPPPPGQQAGPVQYVFRITVPAADAPALTAFTTAVTGPQRPQQGSPAATTSAATTALTISVAGRTWVLAGFGTAFTGRQLEVALPTQNQALQLQRTLAAPG